MYPVCTLIVLSVFVLPSPISRFIPKLKVDSAQVLAAAYTRPGRLGRVPIPRPAKATGAEETTPVPVRAPHTC